MRDRYLTAKEVAAIFQVTTHSVSRWVREGRLPALRTPGGSLRFRRADVDAFLGEPEAEAAAM